MLKRGPVSSDLTAPYWEAADAHTLLVQVCNGCGAAIHYPRNICPSCMSDDLGWTESAGAGTVYSFTVVHRHHDPSITERLPLIMALIDLDEGVRVLSHIIDAAPEAVTIGARVAVAWEEAEGGPLPVYTLSQ